MGRLTVLGKELGAQGQDSVLPIEQVAEPLQTEHVCESRDTPR